MEKLKHGEKIIDGILIRYICQPCPECKGKLEQYESWQVQMSGVLAFYEQQKAKLAAAEEMERILGNIRSLAQTTRRSTILEDLEDIVKLADRALTFWDKAGKGGGNEVLQIRKILSNTYGGK